MNLLLTYFVMLIAGFAIDYLWLNYFAKNFYKTALASLIRKDSEGNLDARILPAAAFYIMYVIALVVFVVNPNQGKTILEMLPFAAFFGFTAYATYDLTNYSTLKDFPLRVVLVDIAWGTFMTTIVCSIGLIVLSL